MRKFTLLIVFIIVSVSFVPMIVPVSAPEPPSQVLVARGPNWDEYDNGDGTSTRTIYSSNVNILTGSGYRPFTEAVGLSKTGTFNETLTLTGLDSTTTLTFMTLTPGGTPLPGDANPGFDVWINDTGGGYKWGYRLRLPASPSGFQAVVDIESDKPLTISDNDTWVDGMEISFKDVIEHNYTYTVERVNDYHTRYVITKDFDAHGILIGQMIEIDPSVDLGQGTAPDSRIHKSTPDDNFGSTDRLLIDRYTNYFTRSIIRFDLSSLPAGSSVTLAKLYLNVVSNFNFADNVGAHRIDHGTPNYETDWTEAGVTWNSYKSGSKSGSAWGTAGGDFNATATDTQYVDADDTWYIWTVTSDCDALEKRSWIFKCSEDGADQVIHFASKEHATSSLRPYLNVTYSEVPPAVSISVTPTDYGFGVVALNTLASTGTGGYFNVTNDGTITSDFTIRGSNATDDGNVWVLASTNGADQYKLERSKDGTNYYLVNLTAATFATSKAEGEYETVDINITMPTSTSSYQQHTLNVTFGAIAS